MLRSLTFLPLPLKPFSQAYQNENALAAIIQDLYENQVPQPDQLPSPSPRPAPSSTRRSSMGRASPSAGNDAAEESASDAPRAAGQEAPRSNTQVKGVTGHSRSDVAVWGGAEWGISALEGKQQMLRGSGEFWVGLGLGSGWKEVMQGRGVRDKEILSSLALPVTATTGQANQQDEIGKGKCETGVGG